MGHKTRGPRPFAKRLAATIFLRVPADEWTAVVRGIKTEFRQSAHESTALWHVRLPTPVVAWTISRGRYRAQLMMLEDRWVEPLGAIGEESLRREGFDTLAEFRRYWMRRTRARFAPTRKVLVYRLRPLAPDDVDQAAGALLRHLYGDFLDGPVDVAA